MANGFSRAAPIRSCEAGTPPRTPSSVSFPVTAVAASANGQVLASGSSDGTLRLWNQATGKESDILGAHGGTITSLSVNPAGNQIASSSDDGTVKVWQLPIVAAKPFVHPDQ